MYKVYPGLLPLDEMLWSKSNDDPFYMYCHPNVHITKYSRLREYYISAYRNGRQF
jgi:hypothetical protein